MSLFVDEEEDAWILPVQSPQPPATTRDLLAALGVVDAARAEQEVAVKQWLAENEPIQLLASFLRADGFAPE